MSEIRQRMKFVAGDVRRMGERVENEQPVQQQPVQPIDENLEELEDVERDKECCDDCDRNRNKKAKREPEQRYSLRAPGRMIFRKGMERAEEGERTDAGEREQTRITQKAQIRPRIRQAQTPAEISRDVYNKMLILGELYQDLRTFRSNYSSQLQDMIEELRIVTFAMGRIYQTISRSNRLPYQNQQKPRVRDFCGGLVTTINYLREVLSDLRRLQRAIDNRNIDTQLVIINLTLMSQQQQLQQMRMDCRNA